jgi:hypothetical protein
MLQPGKYDGKIVEYGIKTTKAGAPTVLVAFRVKEQDQPVYWTGYFTDKTVVGTKATLAQLGLRNGNLPLLAAGIPGGALDTEKTFKITVVHEPGMDDKMYPRVRWIDDETQARGGIRGGVSVEEAARLFAGLGIPSQNFDDIKF